MYPGIVVGRFSKKECDYSGCSDLKCASSSPNCKSGTVAWDFTCYQPGGNGRKNTGDGGSGGRPPLSSSALSKFCTITSGLMDYTPRSLRDYERRSLTDYDRRQSSPDPYCVWLTAGSTNSTCPCNTGYTGATGTGACTACVSGKYKSGADKGNCTDCGAGKYGDVSR